MNVNRETLYHLEKWLWKCKTNCHYQISTEVVHKRPEIRTIWGSEEYRFLKCMSIIDCFKFWIDYILKFLVFCRVYGLFDFKLKLKIKNHTASLRKNQTLSTQTIFHLFSLSSISPHLSPPSPSPPLPGGVETHIPMISLAVAQTI